MGQFFVPDGKRIWSFWKDYSAYCQDMDRNRWTERRSFHVLLSAARDWEEIRRIGRRWLDRGSVCTKPERLAGLR